MESLVETASTCVALIERWTNSTKHYACALTPKERADYVAKGLITLPLPEPKGRKRSANRIERDRQAAIVTDVVTRYEALANPPHGTLARMCRDAGCSYIAASRRVQKRRAIARALQRRMAR